VKWNLPYDYPMVAPNYAVQRSELAKKIGLGQKKPVVPKSDTSPSVGKRKPGRSRKTAAESTAVEGRSIGVGAFALCSAAVRPAVVAAGAEVRAVEADPVDRGFGDFDIDLRTGGGHCDDQ
jgi:ROS/MUCR transcriptional regulator protein